VRYFEVGPEDPDRDTLIEGTHRWQLPNRIGCPTCGVYGATGASHPCIDLAAYAGAAALQKPKAASWREFAELTAQLHAFLDTDMYLGPGDTFGDFTGKLRGEPADFVLGDLALLFVSPSAQEQLVRGGALLPPSRPAQLRTRRTRASPELVELDLPRAGAITDDSYQLLSHRCSVCGRMDGPLERVVISQRSMRDNVDLVRPINHSTLLIASERLRDLVCECELTGLSFREVEVSVRDV
jgi:uncharacterized double-CXXCG motif protein